MTQQTEIQTTQPPTATAGTLTYQAIPADELDAIRAAGQDEAGNPLAVQVHAEGGAPL